LAQSATRQGRAFKEVKITVPYSIVENESKIEGFKTNGTHSFLHLKDIIWVFYSSNLLEAFGF
jgi:hypothetical protein